MQIFKDAIVGSLGWSLSIDETNDSNNTEQESIYTKYVKDNGLDSVPEVCCYFLGLIQVGEEFFH